MEHHAEGKRYQGEQCRIYIGWEGYAPICERYARSAASI